MTDTYYIAGILYMIIKIIKDILVHVVGKGQASTYAAGPVASLAQQSQSLSPQSMHSPVIVIESQNG